MLKHETSVMLIDRANALGYDCSVAAVWDAAELLAAAGDAAYEAFTCMVGIAGSVAQASQLPPVRFGVEDSMHVAHPVSADRVAAVFRSAAGDAAD